VSGAEPYPERPSLTSVIVVSVMNPSLSFQNVCGRPSGQLGIIYISNVERMRVLSPNLPAYNQGSKTLVSRIHQPRHGRGLWYVRDGHRHARRDTAKRPSSKSRPTRVATRDHICEPFSRSVSSSRREDAWDERKMLTMSGSSALRSIEGRG
jgi:hypothetical protein